ncbi:MAG: cystathionine gamma-synthase family protein [Gammaproteobacteria bacterium]|nr:cystathionine gamma-synthase family protein [Gammaproteobacteria bacterium]MBT6043100.1 cystathionine gamma-synthase family protein [Gammaproteobacteria bacterium]
MMKKKNFTSTALHSDREGKPEHGVLHKPIHTSVAFAYEDARELAEVFQNKRKGYAYGRQNNPTIEALAQKITKLEQGLASVIFATGMAAIGSTLLSLLRQGDHIVSSAYLFGNTNSLFNTFKELGIEVSFVDATDVENVSGAIQENTKLVFVETIANPVTQVADLEAIGALCSDKGLIYFVDNTMTSPWLFSPITVQASLVINSLTKYIGGHGNALGGSVTDTGLFDWSRFENIYDNYKGADPAQWGITQIRKKGLRDFGAALAPEAAHHISVGSDTLSLRMNKACANAQAIAQFCNDHPKVRKVFYPGLPEHPQHDRALTLFNNFGAILSIELDDSIDCFDFLNALELVVCSSNLGDNRTLGIPVAHTIYWEMGPERRASMGVADSMVRLSVGIEDTDDLLADFQQALSL